MLYTKIMVIGCVHTDHANPLLYTPAYGDSDDKYVPSKLIIPIRLPTTEPNSIIKYGPPIFNVVARADVADALAKSLDQDKQMTFFCKGVCDDGFIISDFIWGESSQTNIKIIIEEVVS